MSSQSSEAIGIGFYVKQLNVQREAGEIVGGRAYVQWSDEEHVVSLTAEQAKMVLAGTDMIQMALVDAGVPIVEWGGSLVANG